MSIFVITAEIINLIICLKYRTQDIICSSVNDISIFYTALPPTKNAKERGLHLLMNSSDVVMFSKQNDKKEIM